MPSNEGRTAGWIDGALYPDADPPATLEGLEDRVDFLARPPVAPVPGAALGLHRRRSEPGPCVNRAGLREEGRLRGFEERLWGLALMALALTRNAAHPEFAIPPAPGKDLRWPSETVGQAPTAHPNYHIPHECYL